MFRKLGSCCDMQLMRFSWSSLRSLVVLGLWCSFRCLDCNCMQLMNCSSQILKFKSSYLRMNSAIFWGGKWYVSTNATYELCIYTVYIYMIYYDIYILYAAISIPIRCKLLLQIIILATCFVLAWPVLSPCSIMLLRSCCDAVHLVGSKWTTRI